MSRDAEKGREALELVIHSIAITAGRNSNDLDHLNQLAEALGIGKLHPDLSRDAFANEIANALMPAPVVASEGARAEGSDVRQLREALQSVVDAWEREWDCSAHPSHAGVGYAITQAEAVLDGCEDDDTSALARVSSQTGTPRDNVVGDLAAMILKLSHKLSKYPEHKDLAEGAVGLVQRHGLTSPLRAAPTPSREAAEPVALRPEVLAFAQVMEWKLRQHDEKRGTSWKGCDIDFLQSRLFQEVRELDERVDKRLDGICEEAADVANFAMMIADNLGKLSPPLPSAPREPSAAMVEAAYIEGYEDAENDPDNSEPTRLKDGWLRSNVRRAALSVEGA